MTSNNKIENVKVALTLLNNYLLISKPYGASSKIYALASNGSILVINENLKYYISKDEFQEEFNLAPFYVYKNLDEIEIDQEFRNLRQ